MNITVEIQADFTRLRQVFRQFPFASALALTKTAQDVQLDERRDLSQNFVLRNNWVSQGVRIKAATKANLEAAVFQRDDFMVLQAEGGTKRPRGRSLAVPIDARTNKRGIVPTGARPNALKGRPRIFRKLIGNIDGLWQRRGKKRVPLRLLFVFERSVPVKPRFHFLPVAKRTVAARFARQFQIAFDRAIKTAR